MKFATKIDESFVNDYKDKKVPWGPVGYITYKRTYARTIDDGKKEEWWQTLQRCCNGILEIGGAFTQEEIQKIFAHCFYLRMNFSGRALWQLGTETIRKVGADSLNNCWFVNVNDPIKPFVFTMNQLMLGGGVGYNITPESVYSMPVVKFLPDVKRVDAHDVDFIIPDNREGWVELLKKVLKSFFFTGEKIYYSTVCVRSKGAAIRGFGGTASGPEDLVLGIQDISKILTARYLQKLRPIDCLDIMNIIGRLVVAGNVRRSAELALGSLEDNLFLKSKRWDLGNIPIWRQHSNNSLSCHDTNELPDEFWLPYEDGSKGECLGLINLPLCRTRGRLADDPVDDSGVLGTNPCGEITLEPYEPCNLHQLYLRNLSVASFHECAELGYKIQKSITTIDFSDWDTARVVAKNRRLGMSISGFLGADHLHDEHIFNSVYKHLRAVDKAYSKLLGIGESIKLTTVQPDGTKSLLAGCEPGGHPDFYEFYYRTIRFAANDPLVALCRTNGYRVEPKIEQDGSFNHETQVVYFPIKGGKITSDKMSAVSQLENSKWLQKYWSDNSVSVTIHYHDDEVPAIRKWLNENYKDNIKSISFLRHMHGFKQAPIQQINKEEYDHAMTQSAPIDHVPGDFDTLLENCPQGVCPIK